MEKKTDRWYMGGALMALVLALLCVATAARTGSVAYVPAPRTEFVDTAWITLLNAATGTGTEIECGGCKQIAFECQSATGVTAGTVIVEHSAVSGYTGLWALLDSNDFSVAPLGSATKTFFTYPGPLGRLRPRVTVNFTGGGSPSVIVRAKRMF